MSDRPSRTVLLLGATGLVGNHALHDLLRGGARVVTLGRREMPLAGEHHEHHIVDFHDLDAHADLFAADAVACCLGTTIKDAGSQEAFRFVDHDLPLAAARLARARGAWAHALVSAYGADADSRIFYNRVKGEVEDAIRSVGFDHLTLLRPSLLTGDRDDPRTGERFAEAVLGTFSPLLLGPLRPLRPTPAADVALALTGALSQEASGGSATGVSVLGPVEIRERAAELRAARDA